MDGNIADKVDKAWASWGAMFSQSSSLKLLSMIKLDQGGRSCAKQWRAFAEKFGLFRHDIKICRDFLAILAFALILKA